jgi:hypothetical protein
MPQRIEIRDLSSYLYTCIQNIHIHNSQKVKTTQVSVDGWMDKQSVVYACSEILCSFKKGRKF